MACLASTFVFPTADNMPEYDISASLDKLLAQSWDDVLAENPKFKTATENWGTSTRVHILTRSRELPAREENPGTPKNSDRYPTRRRGAGAR